VGHGLGLNGGISNMKMGLSKVYQLLEMSFLKSILKIKFILRLHGNINLVFLVLIGFNQKC